MYNKLVKLPDGTKSYLTIDEILEILIGVSKINSTQIKQGLCISIITQLFNNFYIAIF